jgi:predicted nucleotidyltransferase
MLQPIFQQQLPKVIEQLKKHKVKRAFVFGSVCTDKFNEESDLDFLISFYDGLEPLEQGELWWALYDNLKLVFDREIDLVTERSLKNPYFIKELDRTKQLIYGE